MINRCPYCDYVLDAAEEADGYCPRCENVLPDDDEGEVVGPGDIDTGWPE